MLAPLLVALAALGCAAWIADLEHSAQTAGHATTVVMGLESAVANLQNAPFSASAAAGGSPERAAAEIAADEDTITTGYWQLHGLGGRATVATSIPFLLQEAEPSIEQLDALGATAKGYDQSAINAPQKALAFYTSRMTADLDAAAAAYHRRANGASSAAIVDSVVMTLALLCLFLAIYWRAAVSRSTAERLSAENARLLDLTRDEAITDVLTGIGNRRAFERDLEAMLDAHGDGAWADDVQLLTAIFDLDGFKQYNDTFGHAAGDALLTRVARAFREHVGARAYVYRLGGDEFCLLARIRRSEGAELVRGAAQALCESGAGWTIGCSSGMAWTPAEADSPRLALQVADMRMYAHKRSRPNAVRQFAAPLIQLVRETDGDLADHVDHVAALAERTARRLGLDDHELTHVRVAAALHDIGKAAIPDSILHKPAALEAREWDFMRQHTVIGERILRTAPALEPAAELVRASHERMDGSGYPDGLIGDAIPFGARIVAACDAYDAMTSDRCYRSAMDEDEALEELRRCAGSHFDPRVVEALCEVLADGPAADHGAECVVSSAEAGLLGVVPLDA